MAILYLIYPIYLVGNLWKQIHDLLARGIGLFELAPKYKAPNPFDQCIAFLLNEDNSIENIW